MELNYEILKSVMKIKASEYCPSVHYVSWYVTIIDLLNYIIISYIV